MDNFIKNCSSFIVWQDIDIATASYLYQSALAKGASAESSEAAFVLGLILRHCYSDGHVCLSLEEASYLITEALGTALRKLKKFDNGDKNDLIALLENYITKTSVDVEDEEEEVFRLTETSPIARVFESLKYRNVLPELERIGLLSIDPPATKVAQITAPLVYSDNKFYISRNYWSEKFVAECFKKKSFSKISQDPRSLKLAKEYLNEFFPNRNEVDWQKISVAMALRYNIAVITGGPGTGKTTSVTKLISILSLLKQNSSLTVALAAPTGKAADRMLKSLLGSIGKQEIRNVFAKLGENAKLDSLSNLKATTLHSLLGVVPGKTATKFNTLQRIHEDVLIIDEASMIDLSLMFKTLRAVDFEKTTVVFLGDKDQLSSVEAGAVLGDICSIFGKKSSTLSSSIQKQIESDISFIEGLTGYTGSALVASAKKYTGINADEVFLAPGIGVLLKSYRFSSESGIGCLASVINKGDCNQLASLLKEYKEEDLSRVAATNQLVDASNTLTEAKIVDYYEKSFNVARNKAVNSKIIDFEKLFAEDYRGLAGQKRYNYFDYLKLIYSYKSLSGNDATGNSKIAKVFTEFNKFRILTPNNEGAYGVMGINASLRKIALTIVKDKLKTEWKQESDNLDEVWFPGLPYIVTKNDKSLDIYNGDIGICHYDDKGAKRVWFENGKSYPISLLSNIDSAFAMTIHKSQGSEFDHTMVILPESSKRLLSKELFYTAVTRAKTQLTIYGKMEFLTSKQALEGVKRFSNLLARLYVK